MSKMQIFENSEFGQIRGGLLNLANLGLLGKILPLHLDMQNQKTQSLLM